MAMPDEVDTPKLAVIGVVGTIIILLIVFAVQVLYYYWNRQLNVAENVQHKDQALARYEAEQAEKLHRTAWIDQKTGKVVIPIERAMELTVRDMAAGAAAPAAAPAPAAQPATAAPRR